MNIMLQLSMFIEEEIQKEFNYYGLSGNLLRGIKIEFNGNGYDVEIPASTYEAARWLDKKIVVHDGKGSYLQYLNSSGKHKGFLQRCVEKAIERLTDILDSNEIQSEVENE